MGNSPRTWAVREQAARSGPPTGRTPSLSLCRVIASSARTVRSPVLAAAFRASNGCSTMNAALRRLWSVREFSNVCFGDLIKEITDNGAFIKVEKRGTRSLTNAATEYDNARLTVILGSDPGLPHVWWAR